MQLYSTHNPDRQVNFRTAVLEGLAPDGGLYMPCELPRCEPSFWNALRGVPLAEKAQALFDLLLADEFTSDQRCELARSTFTFEAPVRPLEDNLQILELFHGPTLAFKDFGARCMAAMLSIIASETTDTVTILTATSGDTGAAVAHGFHGTPGVEVYILYPSGQVSAMQEKQFATLGGNIRALRVDGTFDDCQKLVKQAFSDKAITAQKRLTTANSINIARLLPQILYYVEAVCELHDPHTPDQSLLCSVPSGNFGNLTAGLMAWKMGLPVDGFVAATNINHVVPDYLQSGIFQPAPSLRTLSNAMDVGNPSNFDRILALFGGEHAKAAAVLKGAWFTDQQVSQAIGSVWNEYGYMMDPHTAVGYLGALEHLQPGQRALVLATAHPAKFPEAIASITASPVETPRRLADLKDRPVLSIPVQAGISELRRVMLSG